MGPETSSPPEQQQQNQQQPPPGIEEAEAEDDDDAGSLDVLIILSGRMLAVFFKSYLWVSWWVCPCVSIVCSMVVCGRSPLFSFSLSVLLYCANGYHAWIRRGQQ
mmetsp:Transcript_6160/g.6652  ORF Transcript_6160/g.6652 Transcript_6160/m.6652 type:complete len:105 (-) Transcript_6160:173-487(-)